MSIEIAFTIAGAAAIFLTLVLYVSPITGFYALIGTRLFIESFLISKFETTATYIFGIFAMVFVAIATFGVLFIRNFKAFPAVIRVYYLFIFICLLSLCFSQSYLEGITGLLKYVSLAAIFLLAFNLPEDQADVERSFKYLVLTSVFPILFGYLQVLTGNTLIYMNFWGQSYHAVYSSFAHPNQYAFYLANIGIALYVILARYNTRRLLYILIGSNIFLSILLTFSRSVWFGMFFCNLIATFFYKKLRAPAVIAAVLICIFGASLIVQGLADIIDKKKGQKNSIDFRIDVTKQLLENAVWKKPILGFGPGSAKAVVGKYTKYQPIVPHNDYMRVLVETGFLGLFAFVSFIASGFFLVLKNYRKIRTNNFLSGMLILLVFFAGTILGTNHLGNISTSGIWFCLLGILCKGFLLDIPVGSPSAHGAPL
jgi:O-antigen ligase